MGILERKKREKTRRIEEIISAARQIFMNKGYNDTTMLDIAEKSELSRRTLYLYFKSKEEISFALMYEAFQKLYDRLKQAVEYDGTALDRIYRLKDAYIKFYHEDFDNFYFTVYFEVKLNLRNIDEEDVQSCLAVMREIISLFASILEEGVNDGSFRPLENPKRTAFVLAEYLQSFMQNLATKRELLEKVTSLKEDEVIHELFNLAINSIQAP